MIEGTQSGLTQDVLPDSSSFELPNTALGMFSFDNLLFISLPGFCQKEQSYLSRSSVTRSSNFSIFHRPNFRWSLQDPNRSQQDVQANPGKRPSNTMTPELAWIITVSILLMLVAMFLVLYWVQLVTLAKKNYSK